MFRMLCMLALLVLCVRSGHSFSWDIAMAADNLLEFYNEGGPIYSSMLAYASIEWITYDPVHNRVLYAGKDNEDDFVSSFDIATKEIHSLIKQKPAGIILSTLAYDPATEILYGIIQESIYSFLIKPGSSNIVKGDLVLNLKKEGGPRAMAVDSCGGYIYWSTNNKSNMIERIRFDGTEREVIINSSNRIREGLTIDQQTKKMYWIEREGPISLFSIEFFIESADLNGENRRTIYIERNVNIEPQSLTVSKDFVSWAEYHSLYIAWQIPKNPPRNTDVKPIKIYLTKSFSWIYGTVRVAANYENIGDNCKALKTSPPNHYDDPKASTNESSFCLHGAKVIGESRCKCTPGYTGDSCDVSLCQNYCFRGDCSADAQGQVTCRCNAGYSGVRCEIYACHDYCLNSGVCTLNEESKPICQCTGGYKGERCGVPTFCIKSFQIISTLKDILNTDVTPLTLDKGLESTFASTEV